MTRLRLSPCDAIVASEKIYAVEKVADEDVRLLAVVGGNGTLTLAHDELGDMLKSGAAEVQYDYFSDERAVLRARLGNQFVRDLPKGKQDRVAFKVACCEVFTAAERDGEVTRSEQSYQQFEEEFAQRLLGRLSSSEWCDDPGDPSKVARIRVPSRKSILRWLKAWEGTRNPAALLNRTAYNGNNAKRLTPEVERLIVEGIENYLHPARVSKAQVAFDIRATVAKVNEDRANLSLPPLKPPSESSVRRRIGNLDKFQVLAARKGIAKAGAKLGPIGKGAEAVAPLQRVEMDEWEVDALTLIRAAGSDLTPDQIDELSRKRFWLYVVFDCATRCVLSFKLATAQISGDAIAALRLAMVDKSERAAALGCLSAWSHCGRIAELFVDNGPAFTSDAFQNACSALGIACRVGVGGVPHLRGYIERFFGTLAKGLMPLLSGRVFSNTVERGDYPAEAQACLTEKDLVDALIVFIVDGYHNRRHRGLNWGTPNEAWERLCREHGVAPPPSSNQIRSTLGVDYARTSGRHGIRFASLNYHSAALAKHVMAKGQQELELRVDPEDLSAISCWFGEAWHALPCTTDGLNGVSYETWQHTLLMLRHTNKGADTLSASTVAAALRRIRKIDEAARARVGLSSIKLTREALLLAEDQVFWGVDIAGARPVALPENDQATAQLGRLRVEKIQSLPDQPTNAAENSAAPKRVWRFNDEVE
ncbi:Mu transposase C-terminal domain-containing protein [Shimia ponticola]|uniref:Mu transposase C-terminal domain-containing protein n=1 Tax=Shimia ponticola TaxID=2582893 RepID=UPI0011BF55E6|nr:Mu transposase C-terminal domain-containing protein [Shimia ponticola]